MEAGLIARGHLLAGEIADAVMLLLLLNVGPVARPAARSRRTDAAIAALRALALVPLIRLVALGLPLRDGSDALATLAVAMLVGVTAIRAAPSVGVSLRRMAAPRLPVVQLRSAAAGLALGLAAYLAGAPRLWSPDAGADRVLVPILAAAVAAVVEEVVFRGLVQVTLQRAAGRVGPVVASALFAATYLEAGRVAQVLVFVLAGLIFADAVARSGTLGGAVGGHVLLAVGAGGLWPILLGREHPAWVQGPSATVVLGAAVLGMTTILLRATVDPGLASGVPTGSIRRRMRGLRHAVAGRLFPSIPSIPSTPSSPSIPSSPSVPSSPSIPDPADAVSAGRVDQVSVVDSRAIGASWLTERLWERLGIGEAIVAAGAGRPAQARAMERTIFAIVADRLSVKPLPNLAGPDGIAERASADRIPEVSDDARHRAMDFLLTVLPGLQEHVFSSIASRPDLELDLLFHDSMSSGLETEGQAQVEVAMALTRTGIPIRVWTFPGNGSQEANVRVREVAEDLSAWNLARVIWVLDRGPTSGRNHLPGGAGHHILGEKLRPDSKVSRTALAQPGAYHVVEGNLRIKEVRLDDAVERERFVIFHEPDRALRDGAVRTQILAQLAEQLAGSDLLSTADQRELSVALAAKPAFKRLLRHTPTGKLRIDRASVAGEAKLDGKFLLRTSDDSLSAGDIALAYKDALDVCKRGWRDLKSAIDLRAGHEHVEGGIEAHVQLCWLVLLMRRAAEIETGAAWRDIRNEIDRIHVVTLATNEGIVAQCTELTSRQREIFKTLGLPEPAPFYEVTAAKNAADQHVR